MRRYPTLLPVTGTLIALVITAGCQGGSRAPAGEPPSQLARGAYLVGVLGCDDCHTPKKMGPQGPEYDMSQRLIGHPEGSKLPASPVLPPGPWEVTCTMDFTAWSGPWGISYAINLTPDLDTGIGIWTEEMFVKAMRTGKHLSEGRPILPPMPWHDLAKLNDDDLKAVFAFIKSRPAVKNHVPDPVIAPPPGGAPAAAPVGGAPAGATGS